MSNPFIWLQQDGPYARKHAEWLHPIAVCIVHYIVVVTVTFYAHDFLLSTFQQQDEVDCLKTTQPTRISVAYASFFYLYSVWLLIWRLMHHQPRQFTNCVIYEFTWLCNVTLIISPLALQTHRPVLAAAFCVTVGIDQLIWYIDLTAYFLTGKFPIGVCSYLVWPDTSVMTRLTCTHHLWTIPLILWATRGVHVLAWPLSFLAMTINVVVSRCMIPFFVSAKTDTILADEHRTHTGCGGVSSRNMNSISSISLQNSNKYLNVNLSFELWKDIKFGFLQINYDNPPAMTYLFRLLWRWQAFNSVVFIFLYGICHVAFDGQTAPIC